MTTYTWSLADGSALPAGLSLDPATGIISGTPTLAGTFAFTVQVTDDAGDTTTQPLWLSVSATPIAASPAPTLYGNFPQVITEAAFVISPPVQPAGTFILDDTASGLLNTGKLGTWESWTDISAFTRSASVTRPCSREQGPIYSWQPGTMSVTLKNGDGRFDPDNLAGPYVVGGQTQLNAMIPIRQRAVWGGTEYPLFTGFADGWADPGDNYGGRYAEVTVPATDAFKILAGVTLAALSAAVGASETSGARVDRILDGAGWYTGSLYRQVDGGDTPVQATTLGDTALNLLQVTADSEIGELYMNGAGKVVFRHRHGIITDARSTAVQAIFGDSPGTTHTLADGVTVLPELAMTRPARNRDDTTLCNDVQATRVGGALQEVSDAASIQKYRFPRTYARSDLILTDDATTLDWAQWVLYVSKTDEDRFDEITITPLRDPVNLWPQVLGREVGDRIQVWRRPPGVASPVVKDLFIRGITHSWAVSPLSWTTTWTLQNADRYGSFLVLDDPTLGQLGSTALAF